MSFRLPYIKIHSYNIILHPESGQKYLWTRSIRVVRALAINARVATVLGTIPASNGNASETKANESFDNGVFFYIEAKRTPSIVSKLFSKRSEHIR